MQQKQKSTAAPPASAAGPAHRRTPSITLVNTSADNAAVTELSIGRLTTRPDDLTLSIDWERRTTSVTLVYNCSSQRASQGAAAERRNTTAVQIPRRSSNLVDAAAPPTRATSPCSRGCREGGASRAPRNLIPVPQLNLPTSPTLESAIGQALSGERDSSTPYIPLPRRNVVQAQRAAARAMARAEAPSPQPETEPAIGRASAPRSSAPTPAPPTPAPAVAPTATVALETTATPTTPARPAQGGQGSARGAVRSAASAARNAAAATTTASPTSHTVRVKAEIVTHGDPNDSSSTPTKRVITLHPHKQFRKIRGTNRLTTWYGPTESLNRLPAPPHILSPRRGNLYVHKHRAGVQIWMYVCPPRERVDIPAGAAAGAGAEVGSASAGTRGGVRTRQRGADADGDVRMPDAASATGEREAERVVDEEVGWRMVFPGDAHPDMEGYVLHLLDDGTPRWVKASSAKSYEGGRKLRRRLRRYSEC
ncbi:hypothetical protein C8Q73DRAFT_785955 [Cubamyces lactineus]|nr:hypothetical protein C8Q73DRAFT_785955 [Cubamyces lactineus]